MRWLEVRRGVKAVKLTFPEPTIDRPLQEADILGFYEKSSISQSGNKAAAVDAPQQLDWTDHSRFQDREDGQRSWRGRDTRRGPFGRPGGLN